MFELEPSEERMHKSEVSHLVVSKKLQQFICTEEADGSHKGLKRIHDHVKIVVSNSVSKVELPIPPDRSVHSGP